jgi:phenylalanine-4-hydroxylase
MQAATAKRCHHAHGAPETGPGADLTPFLTQQQWSKYSADDHAVWAHLYQLRMEQLRSCASRVFLEGIFKVGLRPDQVPDLNDVNSNLAQRTGWQAVAVTGFVPEHAFFAALAERRFPTTITIRNWEQLSYLPEPDIFHDVFGHVPLHSNPVFADFLQRFGALAMQQTTPEDIRRMARLFWFTVEFGLIREQGEVKVYGSGLISSHGDCINALSSKCDRREFKLDDVLQQEFEIDHFQNVLFVIESFDQLFEAVASLS